MPVKPNKKDIAKLKELQKMAESMMDYYQALERETKHFLCTEFTIETELQIRQFQQNIRDTIYELETKR